MPFVEAFRQFQFRVGRENFCSVHVSLVPQPNATGEHKTKPTQASVRELRGLGISPDLIVCRSEKPVDDSVKEKISNFCHVGVNQVSIIFGSMVSGGGASNFQNQHRNSNLMDSAHIFHFRLSIFPIVRQFFMFL